MIITFTERAAQVRREIAIQRRYDLDKRFDLLLKTRLFESAEERQNRADLLKLRSQDWK